MDFQAKNHWRFKACDPDDLAKLFAYHQDVKMIIGDISRSLEENDVAFKTGRPYAILQEFLDKGTLVQMLFEEVRFLVELRWFRAKSSKRQLALLFHAPEEIRYTRNDARAAVSKSMEWFEQSDIVFQHVSIGAMAYSSLSRTPVPKVGAWLMLECLKQLKLSDEVTALCHHNLAMSYRELHKPKLMTRALNRSLEIWSKLGGHPGDEAVELAYLAEQFRTQGKLDKYQDYRSKANGLAQSEVLTERRRAYQYLALSDCAYIYDDRNWEETLLKEGLKVSAEDDSLTDLFLYFGQCIDDMKKGLHRGSEGGYGRVPHPPEWESRIISPFFQATELDLYYGN